MSIVLVLPRTALLVAAAAQLALDLDLVVDAELHLELLAGATESRWVSPTNCAPWKILALPGSSRSGPLVTVARR